MAKSKTGGARKSAKASKRSAKKAAQPRSVRGSKNARKASKPKSSAAGGRRTAKARPTATKSAAAKRGGTTKRTAAKRTAAKRSPQPVAKARRASDRTGMRDITSAATRKAPATSAGRRAPNLDRERRTVAETDGVPTPPSSLDMDRSASAARTGRAEMAQRLNEHTSTGPAMTGGDVDADWESAETVGDEATGGDNPTPDQDVVEEIGKALGVEYADDEELQGGEEIVERDRKRWELDPASSDDFDDRE